jgi:hypothetical protein
MTKQWKVLIETSFAHEYYIQAGTYEEAKHKAETELAAGERDLLTEKTLLDESYTEVLRIEEIKGEK